MTDQEMLELAAKAAGIEWGGYYVSPIPDWRGGLTTPHGDWNPLTDDGDALRLAVYLGLKVDIDDGEHGCTTVGRVCNLSLCEHDGLADKHAATRRAIVMAAAEIGRDV